MKDRGALANIDPPEETKRTEAAAILTSVTEPWFGRKRSKLSHGWPGCPSRPNARCAERIHSVTASGSHVVSCVREL